MQDVYIALVCLVRVTLSSGLYCAKKWAVIGRAVDGDRAVHTPKPQRLVWRLAGYPLPFHLNNLRLFEMLFVQADEPALTAIPVSRPIVPTLS